MKLHKLHGAGLLAAGLLSMSYPGCPKVEIRTSLDPNGGGQRTVVIETEAAKAGEQEIGTQEFRELFGLDAGHGWRTQPASEPDKTAFGCEETIADLAGWSKLNCGLEIHGALRGKPGHEVLLEERVSVETAHGAAQGSVRYEATFVWHELKRILIERTSAHFDALLGRRYPSLSAIHRAELRGLMAGHMAVALLSETDEEWTLDDERVRASIVELATSVIRRADPDADLANLASLIDASGDGDHLLDNLPGVQLALFGTLRINLALPGKVVETNGEIVDDRTVEWQIELEQILSGPVTIHARAVVP
jgi:hypothetical protein